MPGKRKDRFTVEYSEKVELCGSYEMAIARFKELTKDMPCRLHVVARFNGEMIAECIPLVIDGAAANP